MVLFNTMLSSTMEGIESIQPSRGWRHSRGVDVKVLCENCGYKSQFLSLYPENKIPLPRGRFANLITKCGSCSRTGHITIHSCPIAVKGSSILVMNVEFEGLQPLDGSLQIHVPFVATDFLGGSSESFPVIVDDGAMIGRDGWGNEFLPNFDEAAPFHRAISAVRITYERI